jgi:hypothetical protein
MASWTACQRAPSSRGPPFLDFKARLTLNRAGAFRLYLSATDTMSNQKAEFEAPLHVTAP